MVIACSAKIDSDSCYSVLRRTSSFISRKVNIWAKVRVKGFERLGDCRLVAACCSEIKSCQVEKGKKSRRGNQWKENNFQIKLGVIFQEKFTHRGVQTRGTQMSCFVWFFYIFVAGCWWSMRNIFLNFI